VVKSLGGGHRRPALDELTEREGEVLSLVAESRSNRAIGTQLYLSTRAVERDVQAIFQKLEP
jgi:DNA-binding NarL/FixJ family response regulator